MPQRGPNTGSALAADGAVRLSLASSEHAKDLDDGFVGVKTPDGLNDIAPEDGALRPGGAPSLLARDTVGLLYQYIAVGFISGVLPSTVYPFMLQYLNASGAQVATAYTLVVLPASFKVFFGILSDCFPIIGFRRRPYMVLGWTVCLVMLLIMACIPIGDPYFELSSDRYLDPSAYTGEINTDAPSQGAKYVLFMFFAAVGYTLSDACADGIMAGLAQREPLEQRGKTQTTTYTVQTFTSVFSNLLVGFCFNGEEYGGTFDFSLSFPEMMIILLVLTAPTIPVVWLFIGEERVPRPHFSTYISQLWDQICKRAVYQVIAAHFFYSLVSYISYTAYYPIQSYFVGVTPINSTIATALSYFFFGLGLMVTSKWGLNWNWRWMIVAAGATRTVIDATFNWLTVWDIYRSQWFWLGPPIVAQLPNGFGYMISNLVIVELIGEGNEGAMFGLMTTISGIAAPFANILTLTLDNPFEITNVRMQQDDHSIRMDITYTMIIAYGCTFLSWVFLLLLPKQKRETQELLRKGGTSRLLGGLTVFYLAFALVWSIMTNIMAIFPSTACLRVAGGSGC